MAKSMRTTPRMGVGGGSDRKDKRMANRKLRRKVHQRLCGVRELSMAEAPLPLLREISSVERMTKGGKTFLGNIKSEEEFMKLMRK